MRSRRFRVHACTRCVIQFSSQVIRTPGLDRTQRSPSSVISTEPSRQFRNALAHIGIERGQALGIQLQRQQRRSAGQRQRRAPRLIAPVNSPLSHSSGCLGSAGGRRLRRRQRLAMVAGKRWFGLRDHDRAPCRGDGSSKVFKKALAPLAFSASAPSMMPTL